MTNLIDRDELMRRLDDEVEHVENFGEGHLSLLIRGLHSARDFVMHMPVVIDDGARETCCHHKTRSPWDWCEEPPFGYGCTSREGAADAEEVGHDPA